MADAVHLDLDGAWGHGLSRPDLLGIPVRDLGAWGPQLRYCAPSVEVEAFDAELGDDSRLSFSTGRAISTTSRPCGPGGPGGDWGRGRGPGRSNN